MKHPCQGCGRSLPLSALRRHKRVLLCKDCLLAGRTHTLVETLRFAIHNKLLVAFTYHGEERLVEPHVMATKDERAYLHAWQEGKGWRTFFLDEVSGWRVRLRRFEGQRGEVTERSQQWSNVLSDVIGG